MKNLVLFGALCVVGLAIPSEVMADRPIERIFNGSPASRGNAWAQGYAANRPWHGQYYYLPYAQPTALVVPPNVAMQQNYSWGVSQNTMTPVYHQYGFGGQPSSGGAFLATPRWPSNTNQFGVYPVRAPW